MSLNIERYARPDERERFGREIDSATADAFFIYGWIPGDPYDLEAPERRCASGGTTSPSRLTASRLLP